MNIQSYAKVGNIEAVKQELSKGVNVDETDDCNRLTALMEAVKSKNAGIDMLKLLIEKGADVNAVLRDSTKDTPLSLALKIGDFEKIKFLLDSGANVNYRRVYNTDALLDVLEPTQMRARLPIIKLLIERGAKLNNLTRESDSAARKLAYWLQKDALKIFFDAGLKLQHLKWNKLMYAVVFGTLDDVKKEAKKEKDHSKKDVEGRTAWLLSLNIGDLEKAKFLFSEERRNDIGSGDDTPFIYAILGRNEESVKWLIKEGFNVNAANSLGLTPLIQAAGVGSSETIEFLLKAKAKVNAANFCAKTALMRAAEEGELECLKLLLKAKAKVDLEDEEGETALAKAVKSEDVECVELLLQYGANANGKCGWGGTILTEALRIGKSKAVKLLIERGADINAKTSMDESCLMLAAEAGSQECIKLLLEKGADLDYTSEFNDTVISYANDFECAKLLLREGQDLNGFNKKLRQKLKGFEWTGLFTVSKEEQMADKSHRFGKTNPELMDVAFWRDMVRSGKSGWAARDYFEDNDRSTPIWCFSERYGVSFTLLPDGRVIEIAGEHEDFYDPDFCIYTAFARKKEKKDVKEQKRKKLSSNEIVFKGNYSRLIK
jgi:ankyrin repeat protein